jgi:hypothetical protein
MWRIAIQSQSQANKSRNPISRKLKTRKPGGVAQVLACQA